MLHNYRVPYYVYRRRQMSIVRQYNVDNISDWRVRVCVVLMQIGKRMHTPRNCSVIYQGTVRAANTLNPLILIYTQTPILSYLDQAFCLPGFTSEAHHGYRLNFIEGR